MTGTHPTDTGPRWWLGTVKPGGRDDDPWPDRGLWGPVDGDYYDPFESTWALAHEVSDLVPAVVQPESTPDTDDEIEAAMKVARTTREYRAGAAFDVPHDAVESYTQGILRAVLAARRSAGEA